MATKDIQKSAYKIADDVGEQPVILPSTYKDTNPSNSSSNSQKPLKDSYLDSCYSSGYDCSSYTSSSSLICCQSYDSYQVDTCTYSYNCYSNPSYTYNNYYYNGGDAGVIIGPIISSIFCIAFWVAICVIRRRRYIARNNVAVVTTTTTNVVNT